MKMPIENYYINSSSTIKEAMKNIDKNTTGAVLVVNENRQLLGTITDGDIRRAILKGYDIDGSIEGIYNKRFKYISKLDSKKKAREYMLKFGIRQLPVLDKDKKILDIIFFDDILSYEEKENYVFILAGGLGTRLRPLTESIPKPMLNVGNKPILELIIEQFREYGYRKFIIALNYKGEIIEDYFKDGNDLGVSIEYIKEPKKLGTAGSIKLAENKLTKPFIVINGDILTGIDFDGFLKYHIDNKFHITAAVRNYEIKIPYGVMDTENMIIKSLIEKPTYTYHINAGVYVVNPEVIKYIPNNEMYNMTELIEDSIKNSHRSGVYHITEYWTDIGHFEDYESANRDVKKFF